MCAAVVCSMLERVLLSKQLRVLCTQSSRQVCSVTFVGTQTDLRRRASAFAGRRHGRMRMPHDSIRLAHATLGVHLEDLLEDRVRGKVSI